MLHLHHFEVLGRYHVRTEVDGTPRLAAIVDNPPLGAFDRDWVRAHHHFLDDVLLHDAYRSGLDAAQVLAAQEWIDELAAAEKRAKEEEAQRRAAQEGDDASTPNYLPNKGIFATARRLLETLEALLNLTSLEGALQIIGDHLNPFTNVAEFDLFEAERLVARSAWWTQFNAAYGGVSEQAEHFVEKMTDALARASQQESADDVVAAVGAFVERLDDGWLVALKSFGAGYLVALLFTPAALVNPLVYAYIMKLLYAPDDMGLMVLITTARADYAQHKAKQSAETLAPPAPAPETIAPADLVQPPPRAYTQRELAEAHAALDRLVLHLQAHEAHYTNAFYRREAPELRMDRLRQIGVAEYVENRLLGFAGTAAIFPLRLESLPQATRDALVAMMQPPDDTALPASSSHEITLPTSGVVSELVLGECEALEPFLVERRAQDHRERELRNEL
ncbi:MAG: hypothetical protein KC492_25115, partial [Myxococcales bacterium]|nr:hypothetical protein [Myxococcales bacterium]